MVNYCKHNEESLFAKEMLEKEKDFSGIEGKSLVDFYCKIGSSDNFYNSTIIKENIIERLGMNNLAFSVYIDNIRYDFLFTKNNISMTNNYTKESFKADYNGSFFHFLYSREIKEGIKKGSDLIYKKNNNGISIANAMIRNDKILSFPEFLNEIGIIWGYHNTLTKEFAKAILESNEDYEFCSKLLSYCFNSVDVGGVAIEGYDDEKILKEIIDSIFSAHFSNTTANCIFENNIMHKFDFNTLKQACSSHNIDLVKYVEFNHIGGDSFSLNNKEQIIELFEVIIDPVIALYIIDNIKIDMESKIEEVEEVEKKEKIKKEYNDLLTQVFLNAAKNKHIEIIILLLEQKGIDIKEYFFLAKKNNYAEAISLLLEEESLFNDISNLTLKEKNNEMAKILLKKLGIENINKQDKDGNTILHNAFINKDKKIISLLLMQPDLDIKIKNKDNKTAFDYIDDTEIKSLLKELKVTQNSIPLIIKNNMIGLVNLFLLQPEIESLISEKYILLQGGKRDRRRPVKYGTIYDYAIKCHKNSIAKLIKEKKLQIKPNNLLTDTIAEFDDKLLATKNKNKMTVKE